MTALIASLTPGRLHWVLGVGLLFSAAALADDANKLAADANNPGAPLVQLNFQNTYSPSNHQGRGYSNEFLFQPVIPLAAFGPFPWHSINRPSVPLETSAGPDRKTGLGDIEILQLFVPHKGKHFSWGFGAEVTLPTAPQSANGSEKWVVGPAAFAIYKITPRLQAGAIPRYRWSVAGKSSRDDINELVVQPILQYNLDGGWYVSMGDFDWSFDWKADGAATIPLAFQVGRITTLAGKRYNLSLEYGNYVTRNGPTPDYSIRLGFGRLLPRN